MAARDKYSKIDEVKYDSDKSDPFNELFPYEYPVLTKRDSSSDERILDNVIVSRAFADLERESASPEVSVVKKVAPEPTPTVQNPEVDTSLERAKSIAFNSREVRLVGPNQDEVEMKDDVATKVVVALENIQKDATELWGQVNEKLDKGWTDLKAMVERAIAPKSSNATGRKMREAPNGPAKSSLVVVSDVDGYSMADEANKASESAGSKIKGFLSNIGLNESNQKKASDALSSAGSAVSETVSKDLPDALKKAGDAVSETVSKDIPDALKKAGDAVSDTVTKDIPDAFKNFFGK